MKGKALYLFFILAIVFMVAVMVVAKNYYAVAALVFSLFLTIFRDVWSLIRFHKIPPVDERDRENMNKSLINSFILFIFVLITTVFVYVTVSPIMLRPALESYLAFILACIGLVYAISYLYYDKIDVTITDKRKSLLRNCAIISFIALFVFLVNALYAHVIYPVLETWLIFNQVMLLVSAIVFIVSTLLIFVVFFVSLFNRPQCTLDNGDSQ